MKAGTPVAKPYSVKVYGFTFTGEDYAHPLRAMAQWVHRHPEVRVVDVQVGGAIPNVYVHLSVQFSNA